MAGGEAPRWTFRAEFLRPRAEGARGAAGAAGAGKRRALVVLNWTLPAAMGQLWGAADVRLCADGGANRLFDEIGKGQGGAAGRLERGDYIPDIILGDLDSLRPEVRDFYKSHGSKVEDLSRDQDSTDMQKALEKLRRPPSADGLGPAEAWEEVIVVGATGGRLDHELSNINTLLLYTDLRVVLVGESSLAVRVPAGRARIYPLRDVEGPACGLVPLPGPLRASTSGLRWNLDDTEMKFGGLISTSNCLEGAEGTVDVVSDGDLLWTVELRSSAPTKPP